MDVGYSERSGEQTGQPRPRITAGGHSSAYVGECHVRLVECGPVLVAGLCSLSGSVCSLPTGRSVIAGGAATQGRRR